MIFQHFLVDVNESNSFVIACEDTREALLVDAGALEPAIVSFVEEQGLRLTTLFITHDHFDHTGGVDEAVSRFGVEVLSGRGSCGGKNARKVSHGDKVRVGELTGTVLATPGHTSDSISLVFPGLVFTGDALFSGSIGGTSSPRHAKEETDHITKNLFSLPGEYEVHTGHGPSSTIAVERSYNPFFV